MSTQCIPPTPAQQRLVNIGMLIQFHLAAIGHVVTWLHMYHSLLHPTIPEGWTYEQWYMEGGFIIETFVYTGLPISFGILVAVYITFRLLLAHANFGTALAIMISLNVLHAGIMGLIGIGTGIILFCIVPVRLAIPIVLYSVALYFYHNHSSQARIQTRENGQISCVH